MAEDAKEVVLSPEESIDRAKKAINAILDEYGLFFHVDQNYTVVLFHELSNESKRIW